MEPRNLPPGAYENACNAAADKQGITAIATALRAEGIEVEVEQSGGFVMIALVYDGAHVYVLNDDGGINVSHASWLDWKEGTGEDLYHLTFPDIPTAVDHITTLVIDQKPGYHLMVPCVMCKRPTQHPEREWNTCPNSHGEACLDCCPCHKDEGLDHTHTTTEA